MCFRNSHANINLHVYRHTFLHTEYSMHTLAIMGSVYKDYAVDSSLSCSTIWTT